MNIKNELLELLAEYYRQAVLWLPKLIIALLILIVFWIIAVRMGRFVQRRLVNRMEDPLLARFLSKISKWLVVILGFVLAFRVMDMGDIAGGLLAGAGVSAFIIGFAFKDIGENLLAGVMLAFSRPFRVGDTIESGNITGNVVALDLRNTHVKTFDGKDVFIPNSVIIKNVLTNYTIDGFLRQDFTIGVDYETDVGRALEIMLDTVSRVPGVLTEEKKPSVQVSSLGNSSLGLQVHYWLDTFNKKVSGLKVKTEAVSKTISALAQAGIYTPTEIIELKNYQGRDLTVAQTQSGAQ